MSKSLQASRSIVLILTFIFSNNVLSDTITPHSIEESKEKAFASKNATNVTFYKTLAYDIRNSQILKGEEKSTDIGSTDIPVGVNNTHVKADAGSTVVVFQENSGTNIAIGK